jgi:hypothetical protein
LKIGFESFWFRSKTLFRFVHKSLYVSDLVSALPTTIGAHYDFKEGA